MLADYDAGAAAFAKRWHEEPPPKSSFPDPALFPARADGGCPPKSTLLQEGAAEMFWGRRKIR
jgi:hypothetical protein